MRRRLRAWRAGLAAVLLGLAGAAHAQDPAPPRDEVVIIGGVKSHGARQHDFPAGVPHLAELVRGAPDLPKGLHVVAYPQGWPTAPDALDRARTVVWYFDGLDRHPLRDPVLRSRFATLMDQGVGLVTLHQASTLSPGDDLPLPQWLGAARYGMPDRADELIAFTPASHPVTRGVSPFALKDEVYPTLRYAGSGVTPVLTGELHGALPDPKQQVSRPVAWVYERPGGGRSFGYTGLHYLDALDQPQLQRLILNAILWTAGAPAP